MEPQTGHLGGCSLRGAVGMVWGLRFVGFALPGSSVVGCTAQLHLCFSSSVTLIIALRKGQWRGVHICMA